MFAKSPDLTKCIKVHFNIAVHTNGTVAVWIILVRGGEKMITTLDLLNRLCELKQVHSTREVAKVLGIGHTTVQNWRNGTTMSDDLACEIAEMLGLDVDLTLLAILAERSKNQRTIEVIERVIEDKKTA